MTRAGRVILFAMLITEANPLAAQMPSIPGLGMGGMPNMSGMGVSNVAGVLGYCTKNQILGGSSGASSVLSALEKKPGVTSSKDFAAGEAGQILSGKGPGMSLNSVSGPVKSKACNMVLSQAKHLM